MNPEDLSIIDRVALLGPKGREEYIRSLDPDQLELFLQRDWSVVGRPKQFLPQGEWLIWFLRAGRGFGKNESGSHGTLERIKELTPLVLNGEVEWGFVAPDRATVRDAMFGGKTGLRRILPPSMLIQGSWDRSFNKSELALTLATGPKIFGIHSHKPDGPRSHNFHGAWVDEPGTFLDAHLGLDDDTTMSNLLFAVREGPTPTIIITGTPKNNRLIKEIRKYPGVIESVGSTRENLHNLSETFKRTTVARYAGRRLGRQELDAEILEGMGAVYQRGWFQIVEGPPWPEGTPVRRERYWDLASGEESDANPDPDFTAGAKVAFDPKRKLYYIEHVTAFRLGPGLRDQRIREIAQSDGLANVWIEKEPGNAGIQQVHHIGRELDGIARVKGNPVTGDKLHRSDLLAGPAEQRRVFVPAGAPWLDDFLDQVEEFSGKGDTHDDMQDAVVGAIQVMRKHQSSQALTTQRTPDIPKPVDRFANRVPIAVGRDRYR